MGKRAPRKPSIVGWFSRLPSPVFAACNVAPPICPLVLAAARASPAAMRVDEQNGSRRATTPDGQAGVEIAEPSPRCDEPARLFRAGWSDSPAQ